MSGLGVRVDQVVDQGGAQYLLGWLLGASEQSPAVRAALADAVEAWERSGLCSALSVPSTSTPTTKDKR